MLEQMREAGAAARFVLRADPVVDRHPDDRRLAVGVDQRGQSVGQGEGFVGDLHLLDERGQRGGFGLLRLQRRGGEDGEGEGGG
jgi:hypothetical protein